jgi:hypothetical protein
MQSHYFLFFFISASKEAIKLKSTISIIIKVSSVKERLFTLHQPMLLRLGLYKSVNKKSH